MRKIRVLIANEPEPIGGVTCWRMYWPIQYLERSYYDTVEIRYSRGAIYPADLYWADVLMCFRPSEPAHLQVIEEAKRVGCRILLDYDDDLTNMVVGHPEFWKLGTKKEIVERAISLADEVWVSTEALAASSKHPNAVVIPNAVSPLSIQAQPADFKTKTVVWAGSPAHREDADEFKEAYRAIIRKADRFIWINFMPTWASKMSTEKANVQLSPWIHTEQYFKWMRQNNVVAIWKPLITNEFNACKSNIAYITSTVVGAVCVTNQAGTTQWEHAVKNLPLLESELQHRWKTAAADVRERYDLHQWNEVRHRQLLKLANG